jgi:DNA-binding SARP family transcriptional activator
MTLDSPAARRVVAGRVHAPRARGVRRARLVGRLSGLSHRLGVIVAPAGSGKTTLLAQAAEASERPVAWLTLDAASGDAPGFLAHLQASLCAAMPSLRGGWQAVDDAIADLEAAGGPLLLVIDDLHAVAGQPAAEALRLLVEYQPDGVHTLLASRTPPMIDLPKLRLAGQVLEIGPDDLRFRLWEVEELFAGCYGVRLSPEQVAALARQTGGWAAGLQLFHLATDGRPPSERARILGGLGAGTRLTREYLAANVLDAVSAQLRSFLIRTSVLDELTGRRCDLLLDASGSGERLGELERRGLFTFLEDDGRTYRYHDVLRAHLLETLSAELGQDAARALHRRAAELLEAEGALGDAVRSFSRAEDWDQVQRLLGQQGHHLAATPGAWVDLLPEELRSSDPWALLALARRLVAEGSLDRARAVYQQAVAKQGPQGGAGMGAAELRLLDAWLAPEPGRVVDWAQAARAALADPRGQAEVGAAVAPGSARPSAPHELAQCLALLAAGDLAGARAGFERVAERRGVSMTVETAALLGRAACSAIAADPSAPMAVEETLAAAKLLGMPAVLRLAQAIALLVPLGAESPAEHLLDECRRAEDRWGEAAVLLLDGLGQVLAGGGGGARLRTAESATAQLGAHALSAWAAAAAIVADLQMGIAPTPAQVRSSERAGSRTGPLPYATALLAVSEVEDDPRARGHALRLATVLAERAGAGDWLRRLASTLHRGEPAGAGAAPSGGATEPAGGVEPAAAPDGAEELATVAAPGPGGREPASRRRPAVGQQPTERQRDGGVQPADGGEASGEAQPAEGRRGDTRPAGPRVLVRCLGEFEVSIDGAALDLTAVRPQNQALLRILCLHANRPVHREHLIEWLWPDRDPEQGGHSLQVAVSALRRVLEPRAPRGRWSILKREGSGYRLALWDDCDADIRVVEAHLAAANAGHRRGDAAAFNHDRQATEAYTGDLLPADGPAEWAAPQRDRLRRAVAEAYERLATAAADGGDHAESARLAERGLDLDPDRDTLWQRRIAALRAAGNHIAARAAEQRYERLLAALGVATS